MNPKYKNDCSSCKYLGEYDYDIHQYSLFYCRPHNIPSIVIVGMYGPKTKHPSDIQWTGYSIDNVYFKAAFLAYEQGYLDNSYECVKDMIRSEAEDIVDRFSTNLGFSLKECRFVTNLKKDFTVEQVAKILKEITNTCNQCWDNDKSCTYCHGE